MFEIMGWFDYLNYMRMAKPTKKHSGKKG